MTEGTSAERADFEYELSERQIRFVIDEQQAIHDTTRIGRIT